MQTANPRTNPYSSKQTDSVRRKYADHGKEKKPKREDACAERMDWFCGAFFTHESGSFSVSFTGSAVYWDSRKVYDGATAVVTLDDDSTNLDMSAGMGPNRMIESAIIWRLHFLQSLFMSMEAMSNSSKESVKQARLVFIISKQRTMNTKHRPKHEVWGF